MKKRITYFFLILTASLAGCHSPKAAAFQPRTVYTSGILVITQLSPNTFKHTSYKQTEDFGNVPCNGLIVRDRQETIVFDTPTSDSSATALIRWIRDSLHCRVNAIIPTHFHDDCLGGLNAFHENKIPSYANSKTIELAIASNSPIPQNGFRDSLILNVGNETVIARYFGEGHTKDNITGYFPKEQVLFGGCLVKELEASKGYIDDANVASWPGTVATLKKQYPGVKIVVPGHGEPGGVELLDYTIQLFKAP